VPAGENVAAQRLPPNNTRHPALRPRGPVRTLIIVTTALLLAIVGYVLYLVHAMGEFKVLDNLHRGTCVAVPIPGGEDITIHPNGRIAYISSDDRRSVIAGTPRPGAIYAYDLATPGAAPVNLTPDAGIDFRPHGISLYVHDEGREVLFVVNHPGHVSADGPAHTIEIFDIQDGTLVHRAAVAHPALSSPNDVVGVGLDRFYATNDHGSEPGLRRTLEAYLRLPWANVVYYDGHDVTPVARRLTYANGINVSPDGERLYVSEVTRGTVREYRRDVATGALTLLRRVDLGFGVDNVEIDANGLLWIGGHPKLLTFLRHAADPAVPAPSQVVTVAFTHDEITHETVFVDDGALLSGSSVAAYAAGRLLIGSVFDTHILDCTLPVGRIATAGPYPDRGALRRL
jgi:arylesterase / paraoxonase